MPDLLAPLSFHGGILAGDCQRIPSNAQAHRELCAKSLLGHVAGHAAFAQPAGSGWPTEMPRRALDDSGTARRV